jgi:NTP pyrophosphatase (non-canonical NTP hydrolase)
MRYGVLEQLHEVNEMRSEAAFGFPLTDWSPMEWGCAIAGEAGELANFLKKKVRDGVDNKDDIAKEMADVIIYIDLLSSLLEIDLPAAIRNKFNEVSDRKGVDIKL